MLLIVDLLRIKPTLLIDGLGEQASLDIEGGRVSVKQKDITGFSTKESLLYVRHETVALWRALNNTSGSSLSIASTARLAQASPPRCGRGLCGRPKQDEVLVSWFHSTSRDMLKV